MTGIELVAVGVAGILGGVVNALAGGGTLITFPVLLAFGAPAVAANITNTVALCPGYLGGALAQLNDLSGQRRTLYMFGITSALGGLSGSILLLNTREETFSVLVPYLILLAAGLLAIEEPVHRWHERRGNQGGGRHTSATWKMVPIFLASIYGGYFGGGLSVIILAVLALISNESLTQVNAIKQVISLCVNVAAAIFFVFSSKSGCGNGRRGFGRRGRRGGRGGSGSALDTPRNCCAVCGSSRNHIFRSLLTRKTGPL
jgi:uncharacterized membrane protein YfcA